ncbi:MAG: VCBS repeat-containing protein [Firmicutes bacterium]|nr:VCBS repeat-containing protein [Bacillota bacterium]
MDTKRVCVFLLSLAVSLSLPPPGVRTQAQNSVQASYDGQYAQYRARFDSLAALSDAEAAGYEIAEASMITDYFPAVITGGECTACPAVNRRYGRIALFFADAGGKILYKTESLECNEFLAGSLIQPNAGVAALAERDLDGDGRKDILLIAACAYGGEHFKTGDILYQGKNALYRDRRVSGKINRFGMNKDIDMMTAFARDGRSAEFLYGAGTLAELENGGFEPLAGQSFKADFEKFGAVTVVPGTYTMGGHHIFILYLADGGGKVVWNFQPMRGYDNFSRMTGLSFKDVDGDGWADLSVLAEYRTLDNGGVTRSVTDFSIYYQRGGYFFEDGGFRAAYLGENGGAPAGGETMDGVVLAARQYWGW